MAGEDTRLLAQEGRSLKGKMPEENGSNSAPIRERMGEEHRGGRKMVRVQMLLPPGSLERLEQLKEMTEAASYSEVIRNAIRVYEALIKKEVRDEATVQIKERDGTLSQVRIF